MAPSLKARLQGLKLMAFDVDGILTNGQLMYTDAGAEIKSFDSRDGLGIKLLREAGVKLAIITARRSDLVGRRARELGVHFCFQGSEAKFAAFTQITEELHLDFGQCGYMGDDLVDLPVLIRAGFAATVPEAVDAVKERSHYVTSRGGGRGAVREICDMILRAQGRFDSAIAEYLK